MAINWDKLRKKAEEGDKVAKTRVLTLNSSTQKANKTPPKKTNTTKLPQKKGSNGNKITQNNSVKSRKLPKAGKEAQKEVFRTNPIAAGLKSFNETVINDVALAPVSIPYQIIKGKKLVDFGLDAKTKSAKKGEAVGKLLGEVAGYASGYGAAGKATSKAAKKILSTKTGKKIVEKAISSKAGKKLGKDVVDKVLKSATKSAVADATVGTTLNLSHARGEGKKGKELATDIAQNAALDFGLGAVGEALPLAGKGLSKLKGKLKDTHLETRIVDGKVKNVRVEGKADTAKKVAESGNLKVKTGTPRKTKLPTKSEKAALEAVSTAGKVRKTTSKNADEIADEILKGDLRSARGQQEFADEYLYELERLKERNPIPMPERRPKTSEIKVKAPPPIRQAQNEIKVTPSGRETKVGGFDVEGSQNLGIINPDIKTVQEAMESASGKFDRFYKATVNQQHEIDRLSKASGDRRAANAVQAVRSSSGTSEYIFTKKLVNPKGDVIDNRSFKEVFQPVSKNSKEFNIYAQNLNNISRWKQGKPLDVNVSAEESQRIVNEILSRHPEFAQITENINDYWRKFTHSWLVDTGRMSENAWQAMIDKYPNYVPAFMKDKGVKVGGSKFAVDAGTKGAKAGTTLDRVPIEDAMMEQVQQLVNSTRKNDMYLSVIDTLRKDPENLKRFGVVKSETSPVTGTDIDEFLSLADQEALKEVNSKVYTISAMENGQKVTAYINKDLAEAFGKLGNVIGSPNMQIAANVGKKITNPIKAGITGYNPLFAVANATRDIPTALIQSEYGMLKTTKNMFRGIKEMATNGEMWQRYLALGGRSSGYISAHKGFEKSLAFSKNPIRGIWEGMKTVLGAVGEATESIPRFAEFMSSMEKYGDVSRALTESAEVTVNFSRAGEVTKFLDAWTLYLNAAVQGIDKFVRTAKAHPVRTAARSLEVVGVPYALLMANNWSNPHYQDLNDRTKQNYFCIPNMAGEYDEDGNAKTFIKIPLNREYGTIFASTMDVIAGYLSGEANPWNGYAETVRTNFLPPNHLTDNVLAPLVLNLPQNKDFAGRSIVPKNLENVSPQLQYDYSTSGLAKGIANVANNLRIPSDTLKSPMKVDYLLDSFGGYLGQVGQAVTDPQLQGIGERIKGATIDPFVDRFTADPRFSSGVVSNFYDEKEKVERAANDEKILTGGKGKGYIENKTYTAIQQELSDLSKKEREILSGNLSKAEKDRQIKAIREQKNEIARSASQRAQKAVSDYNEAPTYETEMSKQQKDSYEKKFKPLGVSKEEYASAKAIASDYDSSVAKAYALLENGQSEELTKAMTSQNAIEQATLLKSKGVTLESVNEAKTILKESGYKKSIGQAYALLDNGQSGDVATVLTSERAVQRATWLKQSGVTPDQLDSIADTIDANGNGSYSKDEIIAFFNQYGGFTTAQKRAIFLALSTAKNSPY
nr:MAG TPA: Large polyvalent protein associated domain 38 [Caudoviricetes sp.]